MEKKQTFLDKQTFLALTLVFIAWAGWERHMRKKYPPTKEKTVQDVQKEKEKKPQELQNPSQVSEEVFEFEDPKWKVELSSNGLGIRKVLLKTFFDKEKENIQFVSQNDFFYVRVDGEVLNFKLRKTSSHNLKGEALYKGKKIRLEIESFSHFLVYHFYLDPETLSSFVIETSVVPSEKSSVGFWANLFSSGDKQLSFFAKDFSKNHVALYSDKKPQSMELKEGVVLGLGTRYFGQGFVNNSSITPQVKFDGQIDKWKAQLEYLFSQNTQISEIKYRVYFGPKSYTQLSKVHPDLREWVNFGMLRVVSESILWFLRLLFNWTHNWGFSIIIMTFVIRLFLFPLNRFSYKSMRLMKILQPEIKKIREKHREDVRKMNMEIMDLMRRNNARPFALYIPLLVQLPIFFALFRVLREGFEFYQAPFIGWIQDLSSKDPFFVLPILMGVSMFVQQKMTPTSLEPAQEKVLRFLPVLFTFFMLNLPSGLTLYILVSTVFGLAQQFYLEKTSKENEGVKK